MYGTAPGPVGPDPRFPALARLRFRFTAARPLLLPAYAGSAWHGLLGHALRRGVCVTAQPSCHGCLLTETCAYPTLFGTPADAGCAGQRPHPYVLEPDPPGTPRELPPHTPFLLGATLIGSGVQLLAHLVHALRLAGELGFGARRTRFRLDTVEQEQALGGGAWHCIYDGTALRPIGTAIPPVPPCPSLVRLRLLTPVRLKARGRLVSPAAFTAADLLRALGVRAAALQHFYMPPAPPEDTGWSDARGALGSVRLGPAQLRWHDLPRYSSRQDTDMCLGGLLGELTLAGEALPAVWPLLWIGQWLHVGKATSFGLGRYRIVSGAPLTERLEPARSSRPVEPTHDGQPRSARPATGRHPA
jgi:hypothetical protein